MALLGVSRRLKARLPQGNLDPAAMFVLHQVQANGSLRVSELAGCMGLDASTASRHVRHLEDGGYLARTGDPGDRRASRVRLTPKGIREHLKLNAPIYSKTAAYGHFGRDPEGDLFTWEKTDLVDALKAAIA